MKYLGEDEATPTILSINTDTDNWAANWTGPNGVAKPFYITVYDDSDMPVTGVAITLVADSGDSVGELLDSSMTNNAGIATCRVLFNSYEVGDNVSLIFAVSNAQTITASTTVAFVAASLPNVRFPLALDGVIDDSDYASNGLIATQSFSDGTIQSGYIGLLYWGQTPVVAEALIDNSYFIFNLNGRDDLFQNQLLRYRGLIISPDGKGVYSPTSYVSIERTNGGEGFKYLTGSVTIPEADSTGYVNTGMAKAGVTVLIESGDIVNEDDELIAENYLHNSGCTAMLILTGKDNDGNTINNLRYNVTLNPDGAAEYNSDNSVTVILNQIGTTDTSNISGSDFFNNLGLGRAYLNLNVIYNETPYSLNDNLIKSYVIDVVP